MDQKIDDSIYYLLLQGGFEEVQEPKLEYGYIDIAVYFDKGISHFPKLEKIEKEFGLYTEHTIKDCIKSFTDEEIISNVKIEHGLIDFDYQIKIPIEKGDKTTVYEDFSFRKNINLLDSYNLAYDLINEQENSPGFLVLDYLNTLSYQKNIYYEILEVDNNLYIITLILDPIDERGYVAYNFVVNIK